MTKTKLSKLGKRLIAAIKEGVDHAEGRTPLPMRYVEVLEDVDVKAIRSKLGLSQAEFSRRYAVSRRSLQEWMQGRRRPESAVRAYLPHRICENIGSKAKGASRKGAKK